MAKRLSKVEQSFIDTVRENNLINYNDVIVVGVSGGPDSIALLSCLNTFKDKYGYKIIVAHINHMIRTDANDDEEYVKEFCKKLDIPCFVKRADVTKIAKENKRGEEETGRKIRYDFFDEVAQKCKANKIAIAHNMNDNAETVLLNIIRGSGLKGLEGIQPREYGKYIRPLINCQREDIEKYCEENNLRPRIDSTNSENIYKRNIIRNKILPELQEINPNIVEGLSRMSQVVKENNDFVTQESAKTYINIAQKEKNVIKVDSKKFNCLENSIRANLILYIVNELCGETKDISKNNINDVVKLANNGVGNKYIYIRKDIKVSMDKGILKFEKSNLA